jgi:peptide/nickel transport system substrate-binding protein
MGRSQTRTVVPGERSVFTRHKNYWRPGLPYANSLTIIDFPDATSLQNALVTNVIHGAAR